MVASSPSRAAMMSPSFGGSDGLIITKSPSRIPRSIMLSPFTFKKNVSFVGRNRRSTVMNPFRSSGSTDGVPACIRP
jgi:hypothetical protein